MKGKPDRVPISIPRAMINEIERILKKSPMYGNRQQFVESAIREKIEKVWQFEAIDRSKFLPQ